MAQLSRRQMQQVVDAVTADWHDVTLVNNVSSVEIVDLKNRLDTALDLLHDTVRAWEEYQVQEGRLRDTHEYLLRIWQSRV